MGHDRGGGHSSPDPKPLHASSPRVPQGANRPARPVGAASPVSAPLVGRADRARECSVRLSGRRRLAKVELLVVVGEPGLGKTRLVSRVPQAVHGVGAGQLLGVCRCGLRAEPPPTRLPSLTGFTSNCSLLGLAWPRRKVKWSRPFGALERAHKGGLRREMLTTSVLACFLQVMVSLTREGEAGLPPVLRPEQLQRATFCGAPGAHLSALYSTAPPCWCWRTCTGPTRPRCGSPKSCPR